MKRSIDVLEPPKAPTHKRDTNHVVLAYAPVYDCVMFLSGASDSRVLKRWCLPTASLSEWNFLSALRQGSCIRNADKQCSWPPPDEASPLPTPQPPPPPPPFLQLTSIPYRKVPSVELLRRERRANQTMVTVVGQGSLSVYCLMPNVCPCSILCRLGWPGVTLPHNSVKYEQIKHEVLQCMTLLLHNPTRGQNKHRFVSEYEKKFKKR